MSTVTLDTGNSIESASRLRSLREELREPLFRNGHALVLSSVVTAVVGMGFWVIAAHSYAPSVVGRNSVALSTMTFLASLAQLNLAGALARFIPAAGRHARRLVVAAYAVAIVASLAVAVGFVLLAPHLVPSLAFLGRHRLLALTWVLATGVWSLFVLEDGALTGLRRTPWVPVENAGFSLLKMGLVAPFALVFGGVGIFAAWFVAMVVTVLPTNLYLFGRALRPSHLAPSPRKLPVGEIVRYVPYDYLAMLAWNGAIGLVPILLIRRAGPEASADYALAWVIGYALYLVSVNLGLSLIVESAVDQSELDGTARRVMAHLFALLAPVVAVVVATAPEILRLFGPSYAAAATGTLRLIALSAIPFIVTATATSALRARRQVRRVLVLDAGLCVLAVGFTWLLLPHLGVLAPGLAWLFAQCIVAAGLLAFGGSWTGLRRAEADASHALGAREQVALEAPVRVDPVGAGVTRALGASAAPSAVLGRSGERRPSRVALAAGVAVVLGALLSGLARAVASATADAESGQVWPSRARARHGGGAAR